MKNNIKTVAIIVAGGIGLRMGLEIPKQFLSYKGSTIIECSVRPFLKSKLIDHVIIVGPKDFKDELMNVYDRLSKEYAKPISITYGGLSRQESVYNGLRETDKIKGVNDNAIVIIHDGARPNVTEEIINDNIKAVKVNGAAITVVKSTDTTRLISDNKCLKNEDIYPIIPSETLPRELVYNVQTPQTFKKGIIEEALVYAKKNHLSGTDDSMLVDLIGINPVFVAGDYNNIKITRKEDLPMKTLVGNGIDVHKLVENRKLILCGVEIPYQMGLDGHSDADVAVHALMDAILGATGNGDIGKHFPDNDIKYKDADSMKLLEEVVKIARCSIENIDITIIAQKPKISSYVEEMRNNVAKVLRLNVEFVNIKATTTEGLGFIGNGEGIAALATCIISK